MDTHQTWYRQDPRELGKLGDAADRKYGNYDYKHDLRTPYLDDFLKLITTKLHADAQSVLITGSNKGVEVPAFTGKRVTALDASDIALGKLKQEYPHIETRQGTMDSLPFEDRTFDVYACFRAITSSTVKLSSAIKEAKRVSCRQIILSIPNGYLVNGIQNRGMYNYETGKIDVALPGVLATEAREKFAKFDCETIDFESEIVLIFNRDFDNLVKAALEDLAVNDQPACQVCGPITSGDLSPRENMRNIRKTIGILRRQGKCVFDQTRYEDHLSTLARDQTTNVIEQFYKPLFESGLIDTLVFLPNWQQSNGARGEHDTAIEMGLNIEYWS